LASLTIVTSEGFPRFSNTQIILPNPQGKDILLREAFVPQSPEKVRAQTKEECCFWLACIGRDELKGKTRIRIWFSSARGRVTKSEVLNGDS
jgi:hypothetical protein